MEMPSFKPSPLPSNLFVRTRMKMILTNWSRSHRDTRGIKGGLCGKTSISLLLQYLTEYLIWCSSIHPLAILRHRLTPGSQKSILLGYLGAFTTTLWKFWWIVSVGWSYFWPGIARFGGWWSMNECGSGSTLGRVE